MLSRKVLTIIALAVAAPAFAHHSYISKYDGKKIIRLSGAVGSVSYKNPHITFSLSTSSGSWTIETESVSVAQGAGLTESVLKSGAAATVTGWPSKGGGSSLGLKSISIGGKSMTLRGSAK